MGRFDGSLNCMIKVLVIICLVVHLTVLQSTTQHMIYENRSLPTSSQDEVLLELPSRIMVSLGPDRTLLLNQTLRRDDGTETVLNGKSSSSIQEMGVVVRNSLPDRTFNISEQMDYLQKRPINAFDLMTQYPEIPLEDLVNTDSVPSCKQGRAQKSLFQSVTDLHPSITHPPGRKIPKIVHVTSKTRCMPPILQQNLERWKFPDHNFYLHDDDAVERLLFQTYWPQFPHLNLLRPCMISGAAMADLWR
jgi:hypothetical protein